MIHFILLLCHGNTEPNPGPKKLKNWNWNLNNLSVHNFSKPTQLEPYISLHKHDVIYLTETYLDSSALDSLLEIDGCNLVHVDCPNNIKRGGVCM